MSGFATALRFLYPDPHLAPFVQSYWVLDVPASAPEEVRYLHPDGGSGFSMTYGRGVALNGTPAAEGIKGRSHMVSWTRMELFGPTRLVGVRFLPGGAGSLLGISSLSAGIEDSPELLELYDRVGEARTLPSIRMLIDGWLLSRARSAKYPPLIRAAVAAINGSSGTVRIDALADSLALSRRHLEREFKGKLDFTPKEYARIIRVKRAKQILPYSPSIAEVGQRLEYADQAHFTREFRSLIGITPLHYRRLKRAAGPRRPGSPPLNQSTRV